MTPKRLESAPERDGSACWGALFCDCRRSVEGSAFDALAGSLAGDWRGLLERKEMNVALEVRESRRRAPVCWTALRRQLGQMYGALMVQSIEAREELAQTSIDGPASGGGRPGLGIMRSRCGGGRAIAAVPVTL